MLARYASIFEAVGGGEERICITCVSEIKPRGYPGIPVKQVKGSKETYAWRDVVIPSGRRSLSKRRP